MPERSSVEDKNPLRKRRATERDQKRSKHEVIRSKPYRTTFLIYRDQDEWLLDLCDEPRQSGGKRVNKSVIYRALIDIARDNGLSLEGARSEEDVLNRIRELFKQD